MMRSTLLYFAYGSNMLSARLRERTSSARLIQPAAAVGRRLCFHKRSADGSSKCNAPRTDDQRDCVHGVVWEVDTSERPALDRAEALGAGYEIETVHVVGTGGDVITAYLYVADPAYIDETLQPYRWYRDLVCWGALEHRLPARYVAQQIMVNAWNDPDEGRTRYAQRLIRSAGLTLEDA